MFADAVKCLIKCRHKSTVEGLKELPARHAQSMQLKKPLQTSLAQLCQPIWLIVNSRTGLLRQGGATGDHVSSC